MDVLDASHVTLDLRHQLNKYKFGSQSCGIGSKVETNHLLQNLRTTFVHQYHFSLFKFDRIVHVHTSTYTYRAIVIEKEFFLAIDYD